MGLGAVLIMRAFDDSPLGDSGGLYVNSGLWFFSENHRHMHFSLMDWISCVTKLLWLAKIMINSRIKQSELLLYIYRMIYHTFLVHFHQLLLFPPVSLYLLLALLWFHLFLPSLWGFQFSPVCLFFVTLKLISRFSGNYETPRSVGTQEGANPIIFRHFPTISWNLWPHLICSRESSASKNKYLIL